MRELFYSNEELEILNLNTPKGFLEKEHLGMYIAIRDLEDFVFLKGKLERLYNDYFNFLGDSELKFKNEFVKNIEAGIWHLGLLFLLDTKYGFQISCEAKSSGFDIICFKGKQRYLIEAVTSSVGQKYRNPPIEQQWFFPEYNDACLRLTTSLDEKRKKIKKYQTNGLIKDNDIVLVALNSNRVDHSRFSRSGWRSLVEELLSGCELTDLKGKKFSYDGYWENNRANGVLYSYSDICNYLIGQKYTPHIYKNPLSDLVFEM